MLGWRAYYSDGRTFASDGVAWAHLPPEGMVGVVVYLEPPYRTLLTGGDWYWMEDGEIRRTKNHPEWGEWADPPEVECAACVKKSGAMSDDAFEALLVEMMEAREWP